MSAPASATRRICAIVSARFAVSVLVIVCTATGAPPPIGTLPTWICRVNAISAPIVGGGAFPTGPAKKADEARVNVGHEAEIRRLREERDAARRLLDLAGTSILVVGLDGRISTVNRAAGALLGYPQAELIGQDFFDALVPPS